MFPSQLAEATLLGSCGCQRTWIQTSSWAFHLDNNLVVFQSQINIFPSPSPEVRYVISGEKSSPQAYPATMCPLKTFFLTSLNLSPTWNTQILLSKDWQAIHLPLGEGVTAGILCMLGSAIYFMSTGIFHSQTRRDLSSLVDTNRRFLSTNVIVLTAAKCRSYSCTISPDRISQQTILLALVPATMRFCLSSSGLNLQQNAIFLLVNLLIACPVSVSHSFIYLEKYSLTTFFR